MPSLYFVDCFVYGKDLNHTCIRDFFVYQSSHIGWYEFSHLISTQFLVCLRGSYAVRSDHLHSFLCNGASVRSLIGHGGLIQRARGLEGHAFVAAHGNHS